MDVIFLDDISKEFENFTTDEYFAGVKQLQEPCHSPFSLNVEDDLVHFTPFVLNLALYSNRSLFY